MIPSYPGIQIEIAAKISEAILRFNLLKVIPPAYL